MNLSTLKERLDVHVISNITRKEDNVIHTISERKEGNETHTILKIWEGNVILPVLKKKNKKIKIDTILKRI